jgi:glycine oxidase
MPDHPPSHPATPLAQDHPFQEVVIVGGGLIGLSIALELHHRGIHATVLETGRAMAQASTAAAGMLAAEDPHNPPELLEISRYSLGLYPEFLRRIEALSGLPVPIQTKVTIQHSAGTKQRLDEDSLDPRQLAASLLGAIRAAGIDLRENCGFVDIARYPDHTFIIAAGAWSDGVHFDIDLPVAPIRGQMLRVALPESLRDLREVHRNGHVYIVPRTAGPQSGSALIGATVEDIGFDVTTRSADLATLRTLAAELLPALADEQAAPAIESWAGLRPATPDKLPLLGQLDKTLIATGHFRNGILLAPATAALIADILQSRSPTVSLSAFTPARFSR